MEKYVQDIRLGRKNWVLIDTVNGANASAIVYSIVETAKANKLKPYEYLKHLLTEIPQHTVYRLRGESFRRKNLETVSLQTGKVKVVEPVTETTE